MAKRHYKKAELHLKEDPFVNWVTETIEWFKENRTTLAYIVTGVLLIIVGYFGYNYYQDSMNRQAANAYYTAWDNYSNAFTVQRTDDLVSKDEVEFRLQQAEENFSRVANQFSSSNVSEEALYYLGKAQYEQGKFTSSIETFKQYLKKYPDGYYAASARLAIAFSLEGDGRVDEAMTRLEEISRQYPDSPLRFLALMELARLYEDKGNLPKARELYQQVKSQVEPGTTFARQAERKLAVVEARMDQVSSTESETENILVESKAESEG